MVDAIGRVASPPRVDDCRPLAAPTFGRAGAANWWWGSPYHAAPVRTMVRITEVDAHGHEIETKEEPKTRQLVNLSPADAKAVADHERKAL